MRTTGCTVQQALTTGAASVVKEAVTLAKRRAHTQVTPLHVAITMLTTSNGLLRSACLKSNSHPLQCKALELCFNVALNRLPASSSSSMFGAHSQCPSISNALVAAFKRAQAHQRRGSIESQQQPLLAVKIELEQLIISILDDPSVSRVMREAGFSSTQVKSNVEQAVSLEICSQNNPPAVSCKSKENSHLALSTQTAGQVGGKTSKALAEDPIRNEDVKSVIDNLTKQRSRSLVIVGECLASLEGVVRRVMHKRNVDDDEALRDVHFVHLYPSSFSHLSKLDVDQKISELQSRTRKAGEDVVLYLGDLKWVVEYRTQSRSHQGRSYYCPVEHMVLEIGKLVSRGETGKIKLMALATFQTYMRCKIGHTSLETVWGLHRTLTIPGDSLSLSLITDSDLQNYDHFTGKKAGNGPSWLSLDGKDEKEKQQTCSDDSPEIRSCLLSGSCDYNFTTSTLPAWLQQYKNEIKEINPNDQNCVPCIDLCKKWSSSACSSIHKLSNSSSEITPKFSTSPPSSSSGLQYDDRPNPRFHQTSISNGWPSLAQYKHKTKDHHRFPTFEIASDEQTVQSLKIHVTENQDPKYAGSSDLRNSVNPYSTSCSDAVETEYIGKFKELSAENLKTLCNALEKKCPWQKNVVPDIVSTILQCRSGMLRRKGKLRGNHMKEETWLLFQGVDMDAKEKIARELATLVFGSQTNLVSIGLSSFSSIRADSTEDWRNKRLRDEQSCSFIERFGDAVSCNPHRVFLVEDIEQADYCSQVDFKRAMERGRVTESNGEEISLSDAIIILSSETFCSSRSRACSPPVKQKWSEGSQDEKSATSSSPNLEDTITSPYLYLDLNISIDDHDTNLDHSVDDIGLLEYVDRRIIFKIQEL